MKRPWASTARFEDTFPFYMLIIVAVVWTPTSEDVFSGALRQQCIVAQKEIHSLAGYRVSDKFQ
jgi:hypothetical protein